MIQILMQKIIIGEHQQNQKFKQQFMITTDDFELGAVDYTPFSNYLKYSSSNLSTLKCY